MTDKMITSKDNPIFKGAVRLLRRKYRDETGTYLLEGIKPLKDAINQDIEIKKIFVRDFAGEEKAEAQRGFLLRNDKSILLSGSLFDQLSNTENSQGVIAIVGKKQLETGSLTEIISGIGKDHKESIVILDRLQDPGNIGTIVRTAEAAGFAMIITIKGTADIYSSKVVRAAAGSLLRMKVVCGLETDDVISFCRKGSRPIVVTTLCDATNCFETDLTKSAIVIGNEGNGVSDKFIAAADKKIKIPMKGEIESLNAAVAAGVLMFESARQEAAGKAK